MSNNQIQLIQLSTEQLQNVVIEGVKTYLNDFRKQLEPKTPTEYLTRREVAKMLSVDLSTIHNWKKKGILKAYQVGGRVIFKREDVENAIVELKN